MPSFWPRSRRTSCCCTRSRCWCWGSSRSSSRWTSGPNLGWVVLVLGLGSLGFVALATLFAAIATGTSMAETLLPILVFPLLLPMVVFGVGSTGRLIAGRPSRKSRVTSECWEHSRSPRSRPALGALSIRSGGVMTGVRRGAVGLTMLGLARADRALLAVLLLGVHRGDPGGGPEDLLRARPGGVDERSSRSASRRSAARCTSGCGTTSSIGPRWLRRGRARLRDDRAHDRARSGARSPGERTGRGSRVSRSRFCSGSSSSGTSWCGTPPRTPTRASVSPPSSPSSGRSTSPSST